MKPLGSGLENSAYLVGDSLVVRFAADEGADVEREAALLRIVAEVAPVPVPRPVFVVPETRCLAYEYLPGIPLLELPAEDRTRVAADAIPAEQRPAVERFLEAARIEPATVRVFSHNDLGIEHVLVDPATLRITGVIDWSDAALTDPAYDFGLLLRDLGPVALAECDAEAERAWFYARCALLEDLAYGIETKRNAYVEKSLAAIESLFSDPL